ncbi:PREDICTED: putative late blight resistance protein homolog R1B-16 isoform X2 [Ipomoea nil]|uniref:putative late blight resistance protein homolog R1B-16 isoform X2 n=1 Tax=Ipomoea nil TaxID=35883 RepID=UPI0009013843|nr:PREDICTED: putative late blight resistance protein homolog R1B-16 isoform X2 [Ipomoea nil]
MMPNISNPDNDIVVGFKKEEETIIEYLFHGSDEREVILITGMGGLGKTTLAKRVYEKKNVANFFDECAWCTVSQEYDCKGLLNKIYGQVCGSEIKMGSSVSEELRKSLMGKRYLIVLDDIWSPEAWEELNRVFPSCDNGSRIVLTSREENVVSDAKHIHLPFFSTDESWELLQVKLFKGKGCPKELENVGREISKKCGGLPLTVGLIAGLLEKDKNSEKKWRKFLLTLNSHVTFGDGIQSNDAIELSYRYLSDHLKPCLLYFAAFLEDEKIKVSKLIELWISEGFIIGMTEKERVEDEAEDYLNHLVSSNLIMVSGENYDGRIISCTVHDLVRDFCLTKAREEISMEIINMEKKWDPTLNFIPHRMCFHMHSTSDNASKLVPRNSSIHTVLVFHHHYSPFYNASWIAKKFEHLTILDLEAIRVYQSFLSEVSSLTHLRYLALEVDVHQNDDANDVSPLLLQNLKCLITLKLRSNKVHFPIFLGNMSTLRHMVITGGVSCNKSCMEKSRSVMIEAIPACSKELQTWESRCPLTPMHEDLLRKLPCLKVLRCGVSSSDGFPEIDFLHHLETLELSSNYESFPLSKFPSSIKKIHLHFITLSVSAISTIAQLPNLGSLILLGCKFEESLIWILEEETKFPKLKILQLVLLDIGIWNISNVAESFPCLEQLDLGYCRNLLLMPSSFDDVITLKKIFVTNCNHNVDSWAKNIEESARDIGNEQLNVEIIKASSINSEHESIYDSSDSNSEHESNFVNEAWNKFKLVVHAGMRKFDDMCAKIKRGERRRKRAGV